MPIGKAIAQACHAVLRLNPDTEPNYPLIVLGCSSEKKLGLIMGDCHTAGIPCEMVIDAGRTVFKSPTLTCMALGPVEKGRLQEIKACLLY